jgi:hypothetical protein
VYLCRPLGSLHVPSLEVRGQREAPSARMKGIAVFVLEGKLIEAY